MHKFTLCNIMETIPEEVTLSFGGLPDTEHKDGKFRLRRYSVFNCRGELLENTEFRQSSEYNKYQGDITRTFQPIEEHVYSHDAFMLLIERFRGIAGIRHENVEVHQMRIVTDGSEPVEISPEGPHQDGYDVIGLVGISRENITGGNLLLYSEKNGATMLSYALKNGEAAIIDDRDLWHNGDPIKAINPDELGFMDVFVLLTNKGVSK
jgi:hypothetical protein